MCGVAVCRRLCMLPRAAYLVREKKTLYTSEYRVHIMSVDYTYWGAILMSWEWDITRNKNALHTLSVPRTHTVRLASLRNQLCRQKVSHPDAPFVMTRLATWTCISVPPRAMVVSRAVARQRAATIVALTTRAPAVSTARVPLAARSPRTRVFLTVTRTVSIASVCLVASSMVGLLSVVARTRTRGPVPGAVRILLVAEFTVDPVRLRLGATFQDLMSTK
jgi:hypothetical protein